MYEKRISSVRKVIGMQNSVFVKQKRIKKLIYSSIEESILLYGAETWTISQANGRKLLAMEMDFWKSAEISRLERRRNEEVSEIMEVRGNELMRKEEWRLRCN